MYGGLLLASCEFAFVLWPGWMSRGMDAVFVHRLYPPWIGGSLAGLDWRFGCDLRGTVLGAGDSFTVLTLGDGTFPIAPHG